MFAKCGSVIAALGLMAAMASLSHAQPATSAASGEGVMAPAGQVPMQSQAQPPQVTPQERRLREEALKHVDLPGPPIPVEPGARAAPPKVAPTPRPITPGPRSEGGTASPGADNAPAPGDFVYFRATPQTWNTIGTATVAEPSVGNAGSIIFSTANWYNSYSLDGGQTFSFVDPRTEFPNLDGGWCCDQTVVYDRSHDQIVLQLLYLYSSSTGKGSYRTAFAPASAIGSGSWCYYDWNPQSFGLPSGQWLDYPEVALSNNFVWYSANVFNASNAWQSTVIWRIPLGPVSTCSSLGYNWFDVTDRFTFSLAQGATDTMYWFSNNSTSSLRTYHWAENSNTIFWNDIGVATWSDSGRVCTAPDGQNWCARADGSHGRTAWVANGIAGLMWNASQGGSFPFPYVDVARINVSNMTLIDQPIIWNPSFAWIYPGVGVDGRGHIAGTVQWGGGGSYPNTGNFIYDDFDATPPPWEVYLLAGSADGAGNWGDYYHSRPHGTNLYNWVATGETRLANGSVQAWYSWLGRRRDQTSLTVSVAGGGKVNTILAGGINCGSICNASFTPSTVISLAANAASGWTFGGWDGACSGTVNPCTLTISGTQSVTATFWTNGSVVPFPSAAAPQASAGPGGAPAAP